MDPSPTNTGSIERHWLRDFRSHCVFLYEMLSAPRQVGAIVPSSRRLATAMAQWLPQKGPGKILELGPGTGIVTEALIRLGAQAADIIAIEKSPRMAAHLQEKFPEATVIVADACQLQELVQSRDIGIVFSSLPLLNFEISSAHRIVQGIQTVLPRDGKLVQFSYQLRRPSPLVTRHFRHLASHIIWTNLPPARVSLFEPYK
jgi:phosphatidylethanolamine/phosphatidyl-N-methylethanolamine N-methyltransferase